MEKINFMPWQYALDQANMIMIHCSFGSDSCKKSYFELVKQAGFDGVILWWGNDYGDADYRDNPSLARSVGLIVENVHLPFADINNLWLDNLDGDTLFSNSMRWVDDCVNFDIPTFIFHLSSGDNPPPFNNLGLNRVKSIVEKAEKHDIHIAFENLRKVEYLEYVLSQVDSPYAGFCYDSGHHAHRSPHVDLLMKYGSRLKALHLHDNDGTEDQHLLPFDGIVDWSKTMCDIAKTGYMGAVTLEVGIERYKELQQNDFLQLAFERGKKLRTLKLQV